MFTIYARDHLGGFCLTLKTDLGYSDVLSQLVACTHRDLGQNSCKTQIIPEKSLKVHDNPSWRASWSTDYHNMWADNTALKAASLFEGVVLHQKGMKCGRDGHPLLTSLSLLHISTALWHSLERAPSGIQFKLHIYWLSSQPLVSIICFRYQLY